LRRSVAGAKLARPVEETTMARTPIALTIAGSDSGGGAGIQADLKTFSALGVYGASALTALTAQNTLGVQGVHIVPPAFIEAQIASVLTDLAVGAIKTGMVGDAPAVSAVVEAIGKHARGLPLVVDPVMVATSGDPLISDDAVDIVKTRLVPIAEIITPNLAEAARLLGTKPARNEEEAEAQARALHRLGSRAVLVKGGHGSSNEAVDVLFDGARITRLARPRLPTRNTHGTGCTLSAAIASYRALGAPLNEAVARAKDYLWQALSHADDLTIGKGHGPVHHFHAVWRA
jgi:hydroxymethylpyrimidine/phosphomethylpyrimidine kinase